MATFVGVADGSLTISGEKTGALVVTNNGERIVGQIDGVDFDWRRQMGPPIHYESAAPEESTLVFMDDGTGGISIGNQGGPIDYSQP